MEHIVCTPPPAGRGGIEPPTNFSKRVGLAGSQFLEGGYGERGGGGFFSGGLQFLRKK